MAQVARQREVARADLDRALSLLKQEQKSMQLSRAQRISYRLYVIFSCGLLVCLAGLIIYAFLAHEESPRVSNALLIFAGGTGLCLLALIPLLLLNLSLIVKIIREKWCLRGLELANLADVRRATPSKRRYWVIITAVFAYGVGALMALGGMVAFIKKDWVVGWVGLLVALLLVAFPLLRKGKDWLEEMAAQSRNAAEVRAFMLDAKKQARRAGVERIAVPAETIERFAKIEAAEIARDRARAICESKRTPAYSILSSRQVFETKAGLDIDSRLQIEQAIDDLSLQPRPSNLQKDTTTGLLKQRVGETDWEIEYSVDDSGRCIRLVSLERAGVAGQAHA
ncbi:MAG TPA: hypothetical protein VMH04_06205 [Candidatus Solibacter sp.]|nr:hypothetical protein [Candidatus Solibacter sp.]